MQDLGAYGQNTPLACFARRARLGQGFAPTPRARLPRRLRDVGSDASNAVERTSHAEDRPP